MDASNRLETPKRKAWLRIGRFAIPIFVGLVILLGLGIHVWSRGRDPLEIANAEIVEGISTKEARGIVGRLDVPAGTIMRWQDDADIMVFNSGQGHLVIEARDGCVTKKTYNKFGRVTFRNRLRRWLGW